MSLVTYLFLFSLLSWNCNSDDDKGNSPANAAGPSFITLKLDGTTVFNKSTNNPDPSSQLINAIVSTQSYSSNGVTIPANTLSIFSGDEAFQNNGLGKNVTVLVENITSEGTYELTSNNGQFFYSDKTDPVNTYISHIMEPYETSATVTITKIGGFNQAGNGRYVSGFITGTSMSGSISNPNIVTNLRLDFNGGVIE